MFLKSKLHSLVLLRQQPCAGANIDRPLISSSLPGTYAAYSPMWTLFSYDHKNWRAMGPNSVIKLQHLHFIAWVIAIPNLLLKQMHITLLQCAVCKVTCCARLGWLLSLCYWKAELYKPLGLWEERMMPRSPDGGYLKILLSLLGLPLDEQGLGLLLVSHSKVISV